MSTSSTGGTDFSTGGSTGGADLSTGGGGGTSTTASLNAVDPPSVPAGATVTLTGNGFQAGDTVQISNAAYGTLALATVSLTSTVILATLPPSVPTGTTTVKVVHSGVPTNGMPLTVTAGTIYYISTTGSDSNPGTLAQPWRTLATAATKMKAGDTAFLRGGTYVGYHSISVSGVAGTPINFIGYPGETVQLVNSSTFDHGLLVYGSYLTFDHLKITCTYDPCTAVGFTIGAHDVTLSNSEVYGALGQGFIITGTHNYLLRDSVHDNGHYSNKDHGVYIEGSYNTVRGCRIYNNWMYGVHIYDERPSLSGYNVIEGNIIYHNGWSAKASIGTSSTAGIILSSDHPNNTVRNNVLCDNADYAIYVEQLLPNNVVTNNVSCYNHTGGYFFPGPGTGDLFTGNISYNDAGAALIGKSPLVSDNNTYWKTGGTPVLNWNGTNYTSLSAFQSATGQDAHSKVADPQFKSVPTSGFDWTKISSYNFCTSLNPALCNL